MRPDFQKFYNSLQAEIALIQNTCDSESAAIERSFSRAIKYWCEIKSWVSRYSFADEKDEIHFFKYIKPLFVSVIEYSTQRYHALLFRPSGNTNQLISYWDHELERLELFYRQNNDFYQYYTSGKVDRDSLYFVRAKSNLSQSLQLRPYEEGPESATSHDYLVARIRAYSQYSGYVRFQIERLVRSDLPYAHRA